jgi:hypothetical protein
VPRARLVVIVLLAVVLVWLGVRAVSAFDQDRNAAEADAVLSAPDKVSFELQRVPTGFPQPDIGPSGQFSYRPGTWLSVIDLEGLEPGQRCLVFVRNWAGWTLAGAAQAGPDGTAQVRSAAEPRPASIYEVVVTTAVDNATSIPHGQPTLQWFDASRGPPRARPFDFAKGV